jgi:hypothetical protein
MNSNSLATTLPIYFVHILTSINSAKETNEIFRNDIMNKLVANILKNKLVCRKPFWNFHIE